MDEEVTPHTHPCDIGTIDYSLVEEGIIYCRVCGKQWKFSRAGWISRPVVRRKPEGEGQ